MRRVVRRVIYHFACLVPSDLSVCRGCGERRRGSQRLDARTSDAINGRSTIKYKREWIHAFGRIVLLVLVMRVLRVRVLLVLVLVLFSDDSAILRISADIVDCCIV